MVLAAATADPTRRRAALTALCQAYWLPIYAYIRRRGHSPDDAADLTQAFFLHVVEKGTFSVVDPAIGRFRAFLLAAVKHFLVNEYYRDSANKRGGQWTRLVLDPEDLERRYAAAGRDDLDPERLFDRQWAATVLERALARLRAQQAEAGKTREFDALAGFLTSDAGAERTYRQLAEELGTSEAAIRTSVHRLRQKYGMALRAEIGETVRDAAAADAELRHVLSIASA